MTRIFDKLNLKDQTEILVLNPPQSFEPELAALTGITVVREVNQARKMDFVLAFVTQQEQVDTISKIIAAKAEGDALVWFVYPKGTSKKYKCDFNRDTGWTGLRKLNLEPVRQVAIDEDWSALRFRKLEYIKTMTRKEENFNKGQ